MKRLEGIGLSDVQKVYAGAEGRLWELIMGEQVHVGGFASSMDLAQAAGIGGAMDGVDLCCCNGAGMRFLVKHRQVRSMQGVDATPAVVEDGRWRCREAGLDGRTSFTLSDVCRTPLPAGKADFVWGEDAWCYVVDKPALIAEAVRLVKPGGTIAFTDWVEGPGLSDAEAERYLRFMKFPGILMLKEYSGLLEQSGCNVVQAADTGRFAPYVDLYVNMIHMQFTGDALRILGCDVPTLAGLGGEMVFMRQLAHAGKIGQGLFVAKKD